MALGVTGDRSYLAVCEAVAALGLDSSCLGVGAPPGPAGSAESKALAGLRAAHEALYGRFSTLLFAPPAAAAEKLADGAVELLLLGGEQRDAAAALQAFAPKLSPRAVVLFHGPGHGRRDDGVARLWKELAAQHPHLELAPGAQLGLLAWGSDPPLLAGLLATDTAAAERASALFTLLASGLPTRLAAARREVRALSAMSMSRDTEIAKLRAQVTLMQDDNLDRELAMGELRQEVLKRDKRYEKILQSLSFRLGMKATAPMRWLVQKTAGLSKNPS